MSWVETKENRKKRYAEYGWIKVLPKLVSILLDWGLGLIRTVLALCWDNPVRFVLTPMCRRRNLRLTQGPEASS